jgi:hypothetical protein
MKPNELTEKEIKKIKKKFPQIKKRKRLNKEELQIRKIKRDILMQAIIEFLIIMFFIIAGAMLLVSLILMIQYKW